MAYWLVGGLMVVLVLVAFAAWSPDTTGPEDIMPAAGSSAYVDQTNTRSGITADDINNSGAAGGTTSTVPTGNTTNTPAHNNGTTTAE